MSLSLCLCLGMEDLCVLPHLVERGYTVLLTASASGWCPPASTGASWTPCGRNTISMWRRNTISMFMSICLDVTNTEIRMATDQGRVCRPLIIVEKGRPLVLHRHVAQLRDGLLSLDDLVHRGLIEYLDVNEERSNAQVALREAELAPTSGHAYLELIPFPQHVPVRDGQACDGRDRHEPCGALRPPVLRPVLRAAADGADADYSDAAAAPPRT